MRPLPMLVPTLITLCLAPACGGDGDAGDVVATSLVDSGDGGDYAPVVDPADFVEVIDNPYFPMRVGSRWVYEGSADGDPERIEIVVTDETKTVMGIRAVVVRDSAYVDGELVEATDDWFAQDRDGNVWYLGEDSREMQGGDVVSTEGSWEAGVDGARPGIVMPAQPAVGDTFRQEYYAGHAEDMFEIISVDGSLEVPAGSFDRVVTTRDWTPLEPDVTEEKHYAPGIGKLREEIVAGGAGVNELVAFTPPE